MRWLLTLKNNSANKGLKGTLGLKESIHFGLWIYSYHPIKSFDRKEQILPEWHATPLSIRHLLSPLLFSSLYTTHTFWKDMILPQMLQPDLFVSRCEIALKTIWAVWEEERCQEGKKSLFPHGIVFPCQLIDLVLNWHSIGWWSPWNSLHGGIGCDWEERLPVSCWKPAEPQEKTDSRGQANWGGRLTPCAPNTTLAPT